jgi:hypothetical protein
MNGRESGDGTYPTYQLRASEVNRNRRKLRCKKNDLWIFRQTLWTTRWMLRVAMRLDQAGDSTWITRLAIMSRVFAP